MKPETEESMRQEAPAPTVSPADCAHLDFNVFAEMNRLEDTFPMKFFADIKISCRECGLPFHFIGVKEFGLSPNEPCLNFDSTELRCPILPGACEFVPDKMRFEVPS
jgi:hypothetical protein